MNKKGQTLILFVLLIPVLIMAFALIFDSAYIITENNRLDDINETAIKYYFEGTSTTDIKKYIEKNDKDILIKDINITSNNINIILDKSIKSYFGKIIGYDQYELSSSYKGTIDTKDIKRIN